MADGDGPAAGVRFTEPGPYLVAAGDVSTSEEAQRVLIEQGVDAWREWVAAQQVE